MRFRLSKRLQIRRLMVVVLTGLVLAMAAGALRSPVRQFLADRLQRQLAHVPDDAVDDLVESIRQLGEDGLPSLVAALSSDRERVARSADEALWRELSRWEQLPPAEASQSVAMLARALAENADRFQTASRRDAAALARRILTWPLDRTVVHRAAVLADCEGVLQAAAFERRLAVEGSLSTAPAYATHGGPAPNMPLVDLEYGQGTPIANLGSDLISPRIDVERHSVASSSGFSSRREMATVPPEPRQEKGLLEGVSPTRQSMPSEPAPLTPALSAVADQTPALLPVGRSTEPLGQRPYASSNQRISITEHWRVDSVETLELMRHLQVTDRSMVERAEEELVRRGFGMLHLDLAKRLFDSNPAVRIRLTETLPELRSINTTPWLVWLSHDSDPDVRIAAINCLAAHGEEPGRQEIARLAEQDPELRVRRHASQVQRDSGVSRWR